MPKPDYEAFAKHLMSDWPEGFDIDAGDLQETAVKYDLLYEVPGGFDPKVHEDPDCCAEPGDTWFMRNY